MTSTLGRSEFSGGTVVGTYFADLEWPQFARFGPAIARLVKTPLEL